MCDATDGKRRKKPLFFLFTHLLSSLNRVPTTREQDNNNNNIYIFGAIIVWNNNYDAVNMMPCIRCLFLSNKE